MKKSKCRSRDYPPIAAGYGYELSDAACRIKTEYYIFFRSLLASLGRRCVDLAVAAGTYGDDENLHSLTVDVINDANILGADAAVAGELIAQR